MAPRFLLDTNILIYVRQKKPPTVLRRFERLTQGEAGISVITHGELVYGAEKSRMRAAALKALDELTGLLPVLPLPEKAGESYGAIRAALERKGLGIGNNDLWIAAHARAQGLVLVTNNAKEFRRVEALETENWTT
jgi:tRNA(fMet)-specific endonuclease VapC